MTAGLFPTGCMYIDYHGAWNLMQAAPQVRNAYLKDGLFNVHTRRLEESAATRALFHLILYYNALLIMGFSARGHTDFMPLKSYESPYHKPQWHIYIIEVHIARL